MKPGEIIIFKRYANWELKKLFKMAFNVDEPYMNVMRKIRNRLQSQNRNVGRIYMVHQLRYGITIESWPNGIPEDSWNSTSHDWNDLEKIIRITKRN